MALDKQKFPLSIIDGLNTKTDEKNVGPTQFLELENMVFTKTGSLSKRAGHDIMTKHTDSDSGDFTNVSALTTFNEELLAYDSGTLFTYSPSEDKWAQRSPVPGGTSYSKNISTNGFRNEGASSALLNGLRLYTYITKSWDFSATVKTEYVLVDDETNAIIYRGSIADSAVQAKAVALGSLFYIFYMDSSNVQYVTINPVLPTQLSTPVIALGGGVIFDATVIGDRLYVAAAGAEVTARFFISTGQSSSPVGIYLTSADFVSLSSEGGNVRFVYHPTSASARTVLYNRDLTTTVGSDISLATPATIKNIGAVATSDTQSIVYYTETSGGIDKVYSLTVTSAGVVTAPVLIKRSATLLSNPILLGVSTYIFVAEYNQTPTTIFALKDAGTVVGRFEPANASVNVQDVTYLTAPDLNGEAINFPAFAATEFQQSAYSIIASNTLKLFILDFSAVTNYFDATLGQNLHVAGSVLYAYDGEHAVEHGFLQDPGTIVATLQTPDINPGLPVGDYFYRYVFAWRDRAGQLHRSFPSEQVKVTVTVINQSVNLVLPTLVYTEKQNVELELYRTQVNGTIFYKLPVLNGQNRIENDETVDSITVNDRNDDTTIGTEENLYTTGGVLENDPADSSRYITTYKNRIFLMGADGTYIQYSKLREQNGPVEFSELYKIVLDQRGGTGTALAVMDDNLVVFKDQSVFIMNGNGPNNLGEQDDYLTPSLVSGDAGCTEPSSVVLMPQGVMFKSSKGIYLISRGLQLSYLGAAVERYNDLTISSATLLEDTNQVRFTTLEGRTLVFDYFHNRWTTFVHQPATDSIIHDGEFFFSDADGAIYRQNPERFDDNGTFVQARIVSAWIALAGIQGFQRFYRFMMLGQYKGRHRLRVRFAYDYKKGYDSETYIDTAILQDPAYGDGNYGDGEYGGINETYQFQVYPKIQKCQSFKISLEDINSGPLTEGLNLSNMAIELGVKSGLNKKSVGFKSGAS